MEAFEKKRQTLQKNVDSSKSKLDRNKLGQFATPRVLADQLFHYAHKLGLAQPRQFLDPAFGTGSFYTGLLNEYGKTRGLGFEIDPAYFAAAQDVWQNHKELQLVNGDFTELNPSDYEQADLIVCNPPYSRHHHIPQAMKLRAQQTIKQTLGYDVSGLAGLHFYFMLLSHQWLADEGISIWLIPSEIVEVNYGKTIKDYLLNHVEVIRLHFFEQSEVQFDDALVSSCIIVFRKSSPTNSNSVHITVGDFEQPTKSVFIPKDRLKITSKWSKYLVDEVAEESYGLKIGDLFTIKRGVATGNNNFFILDKEQATKLEIPKKYLRNILPSSRYLKDSVVKLDKDGYLDTERKLVLLDVPLELNTIMKQYPKLYEYLQTGIEQGVDKTYLVSRRSPWYSQEKRDSPRYFVKYMNRQAKDGTPNGKIFIKNESDAISTNSYLMLYEKAPSLLDESVEDEAVWKALSVGLSNSSFRLGRTYGGGLTKFEPSELKQLPVII